MQSFVFLIPNLNGRHLLERCYRSILSQTKISARAVLIDNGSTDDSVAWTQTHFPEVQVIQGESEWGFARAINEGIKATTSDWVVLFNNDAWLAEDFGEKLAADLERLPLTKVFACCGISGRDESLYYSLGDVIYRGCPLRVGYLKPRASANLAALPDQVVCPSGYAAIYRRSLFEKLGLLPEVFHSFFEDADFAVRALRAGYECRLLKDVVVYHLGGETGHFKGNEKDPLVLRSAWLSGRNGIWFARRHFSPWTNFAVFSTCVGRPFIQQTRLALRGSPTNRARFLGMLAGIFSACPRYGLSILRGRSGHVAKVDTLWKMWEPWMANVWGFIRK